MYTLAKRLGVAALVAGAVCSLGSPASAQKATSTPIRIFAVNPNPEIAPGVRLQQYLYNTTALGKVYSQIPPYLLGYSPYPGGGYGAAYNPAAYAPSPYSPYASPYYPPAYGGGYTPYGGSPYTGGYAPGGIDPVTGMPLGGGAGYGGGYSPYAGATGYNPYGGGYMYSSAADIQAYGQLGLSMEQARILREQANQAKLDTRKKLVDTLAYIRANEYTFTQQQADIAKNLLKRIQTTATPTEIATGKSLNVLTNDLSKFDAKQLRARTVTVDEDVLKLLNVTGTPGQGNLGLLRNDGQVPWPVVFDDPSILPKKEREDIESYTKRLFFQAANAGGKLDTNTLKDLETALGGLRTDIAKKINVLGKSYLEAKRFLDDFDSAVVALRRGDAALYLDFNQKFAKGGRTVQELVDYMAKNGLSFAPAMPGDERAYQAVHAALAAQSVALHAEVASSKQ